MPAVPETFISPRCVISERFVLPRAGRVVAETGQFVTPTDVVGYSVERGDVTVVDVAAALRESPRRASNLITVRQGQSVRAGEVLARKTGWPRPKELAAPISARAMALGAGMVLLEGFPSESPVRGCLAGTVREVIPGIGLEVSGVAALVMGSAVLGREFAGMLRMAGPVPERVLRPEHLDVNVRGAVVVGGIGEDDALLERAAELGAEGVVVGGAPARWALQAMPLPIAVVEGFGRVPMCHAAFELFNRLAGRRAFIQARGGRCWITVPDDDQANPPDVVVTPGIGELRVGAIVRVTAGLDRGALGRVTSLREGHRLVVVQLQTRQVTLQLANTEIVRS